MTSSDGESGDFSRLYLMVVVWEAAVIYGLWLFERVFS
jgi:hypothetical protein